MLKVQEIRELIKLIDESSIEEFEYEAEGTKVVMKKSLNAPSIQTYTQQVKENSDKEKEADIKSIAKPSVEKVPAPIETEKTNDELNYDYEIKSPMVGTFYSSPDPESDRYVTVGDGVQKATIVCIVEAMKLFNEIEAEVNGEIIEVLVEDGELVEYGQPLFRVKTK